ncbi:hypothetical protein Tcan_10541 [Toxocara canis]|uniref:Ground-like domain-containing protein n=1 Tax=Toxocara canis TaxID=6265 RepID=A0A0B2UY02_TOXCA|nr:hypothetical protein Tcan_10541 [Toxocara canis]
MVEAQENLQTTAARQAAKIELQEHIIERLLVTVASQAKTISQLTELTEKLIKKQREQWLLSDSMKFRRALQIELAHNFDTYLIVCTQQSIQFSTTMPSFCVQSNQHLTCYAFTL